MSDPIDLKLSGNLRRWQESGQPQLWCAAREGVWNQHDWLTLLSGLWWSEYWPMEPAAIRAVLDEHSRPWNLRRWQASGQAWQWITAHGGAWTHDDWRALLESLRQSAFWPLDPSAVGALLEELRPLARNLERWKQSGLPARWVESRQGMWNDGDWLALVEMLQRSEFWPLDVITVGETLEELKRSYHNLIRWQLSGHPRRWVEARQGYWDDNVWQSLQMALRQSEFWPLDIAGVARVLEGHQREWWNLRRWRDSGLARRWVEVHDGRWNHDDWLALLASLRASGYWPIDAEAVGRLLEDTREEWVNLRRWQASGQPQQWVAEHPGECSDAALAALMETLWQTEYWPLDARAVQGLLQELQRDRPIEEPVFLRMPGALARRAA